MKYTGDEKYTGDGHLPRTRPGGQAADAVSPKGHWPAPGTTGSGRVRDQRHALKREAVQP